MGIPTTTDVTTHDNHAAFHQAGHFQINVEGTEIVTLGSC